MPMQKYYDWLVVINKIPYDVQATKPSAAITMAFDEHLKGKEPSILYDIYLVNKTLKEQRDGKKGGE